MPVTPPPVQPNTPVIPTQRVVTNSTVLTQEIPTPLPPQTFPTIPTNIETPVGIIAPVAVDPTTAVVLPTIPAPNPESVTVAQYTTPTPVVSIPPAPQAAIPPPPVVNTVPSTSSIPFATQPTGAMGISDVQCVALNGILDMQSIEYNVLAKEAFESRGISKQIPSKEELNYDDAVVIIKYGNDKFRKR